MIYESKDFYSRAVSLGLRFMPGIRTSVDFSPCNSILTINGNVYTDFTIWDIYGRMVNLGELDIKTKYSSDNKITIDISSLSNGIYFTNLKTEQGIVSKKVIINK